MARLLGGELGGGHALRRGGRADDLLYRGRRRFWLPSAWGGLGGGCEGQVPVPHGGEWRAGAPDAHRGSRRDSSWTAGGGYAGHGRDRESPERGHSATEGIVLDSPAHCGVSTGSSDKDAARAGIGAVVPAHAAAHDPGQDAPTYPGLDPGVVQSALAAGVSHQALGEMASLLSANPALRLKDAKAPKLAADPLDESDQEPVLPVVSQGVASGSAGPAVAPNLDPVSAALVKLTALVEDMHATKNAKGSKLEQALDNVASGQSGGDGGGVTSRKNSVARRALRQALQECPEEIYQVVEKLMLEDLTSTTLSPGMPRPTLSARAWLENRSRLTNYQASVRTAWGVGGSSMP